MPQRYEDDFYGWTQEQAAVLRSGKLDKLDIENVLEEIETMGRSERRELVSCLKVLLAHLLKWEYQPGLRGKSWDLTILNQRQNVASCLSDSPSLEHTLEESIQRAYRDATVFAEKETGINRSAFPKLCPWTFEQIIENDFYPE